MNRIMAVLLLTSCLGFSWAGEEKNKAEVWMCYSDITPLTANPAGWNFVKQNVDGIKLYVDKIGGNPQSYTKETLAGFAEICAKENILVSVELGGTLEYAPLDSTNGEKSAEMEIAKIKPYVENGGRIFALDIDGAINRLLYPGEQFKGFEKVEDCITELLDAMKMHRQAFPGVKLFLLTNFPNWGYKGDVSYHARGPQRQDWGDYFPILEAVIRRAREAGVSLDGVSVDNPYDYAKGSHSSVNLKNPAEVNWIKRIRDLEDYAEKQGLEFNLIVNCETAGMTSDQAFYEETLAYVDAYIAAGGSPKRWMVQSWYPYPKAALPEDQPYSMTALVKAVIEKIRAR